MKTSLVCLLLLAAVVCAAPQAKQTRRSRLLQRIEEAKLHREAKSARISEVGEETGEVAVANAVAEADGEAESRLLGCFGPCFSFRGIGCWFDACYTGFDVLKINGFCSCCAVYSIFQCFF